MSTILNALQKQTAKQPANLPYPHSNRYWKAVLSIALLIVAALLSTVIFLLLKPSMHTVPVSTRAQIVLPAAPVNASLAAVKHTPVPASDSGQDNKPVAKLISRVSFATKRLPLPVNKLAGKAQESVLSTPEQQPVVLAEQKKQHKVQPEIDYSNVSDELQQRFQDALLIREDQGQAFIESENSDGTDLYQMASGFQAQVPAISYDLHIYSSVAKERWIRINGEDLLEGQFDRSGEIQVVEILPDRTVFRLGSQSFSLQSLTDWRGA